MEGKQNIDVGKLIKLKKEIEKISEARKHTKAQLDEIEAQAVTALLHMGIRYIDESQNGSGPYWVLGKAKTDGNWSTERYAEFFTALIHEIHAGKIRNSEQCTQMAQVYLKQFQKRRLSLNRVNQVRRKDVDDLKLWMQGVDDERTTGQ